MAHLSGMGGMDTITDASSRGQIVSRNAYKECVVCRALVEFIISGLLYQRVCILHYCMIPLFKTNMKTTND